MVLLPEVDDREHDERGKQMHVILQQLDNRDYGRRLAQRRIPNAFAESECVCDVCES